MDEHQEYVKKLIEEEKKNPEARLHLNILRVLSSYYGVLWISELFGDLIKFYSYFNWTPDFNIKKIENAVDTLFNLGLLSVEERFKASFSKEPRKEKIVRLVDMEKIINVLSSDEIFMKYQKRF